MSSEVSCSGPHEPMICRFVDLDPVGSLQSEFVKGQVNQLVAFFYYFLAGHTSIRCEHDSKGILQRDIVVAFLFWNNPWPT